MMIQLFLEMYQKTVAFYNDVQLYHAYLGIPVKKN